MENGETKSHVSHRISLEEDATLVSRLARSLHLPPRSRRVDPKSYVRTGNSKKKFMNNKERDTFSNTQHYFL